MKKQLFTDGWVFGRQNGGGKEPVILPHDAMLHEVRLADAASGNAQAYFPGGRYCYEKVLIVITDPADGRTLAEARGDMADHLG